MEQGGVLFAAESDDRVIGFGVRGPSKPDGSAEILATFVDVAYRRQGIGRALLEAMEKESLENGLCTLYAGVNHTVGTVQFYRQSGYQIKGLIDESINSWPIAETGIVMAKPLTSG